MIYLDIYSKNFLEVELVVMQRVNGQSFKKNLVLQILCSEFATKVVKLGLANVVQLLGSTLDNCNY